MERLHPYGVMPPGNAYLETNRDILLVRARGLGNICVLKDDDVILEILSYCSYVELTNLNVCSRALYVYSMHNELWRDVFLRQLFL